MQDKVDVAVGAVQAVLTALLSWIVLSAISIIISGKLIAKRLPIGLGDDAFFKVPLIIFRIEARGDEVTAGFISFLLSLGCCSVIGGKALEAYIESNVGLSIGVWSSLCSVASIVSLSMATMILVIAPLFRGNPIVSEKDRDETNDRLKGS